MVCGVVATSISGCGVCILCRVVCDLVAHYTALNTHHSLKHFYHNTAEQITMYFY